MKWLRGIIDRLTGRNKRIDCPDKYEQQLKRCLQQAERLLGTPQLVFKGRMKVYVKQGDANVGSHWGKRRSRNTVAGAYVTYRPGSLKMQMHLFTDPQGNETDSEIVHEWGHGILNCYPSYQRMTTKQQHAIMSKFSFPYTR